MTRSEILSKPAGREMDMFVKSFVMGGLPPLGYDYLWDYIPHYSTKMKPAWKVVDKFYSMVLDKFSDGKEYRCQLITSRNGKNVQSMAAGETMMLAVCRAALLSVMEDEK